METRYDVLVIGAGPAGSAAARALALRGWRVLLCEKGPLPRHRLCGEFVSPEAVSDLGVLGLDIESVGAVPLRAARVASGGRTAESLFEQPAFGLSRRVLDAWLAREAETAGAELRIATRVVALRGNLRQGFEVELAGAGVGPTEARVVIGAYGKQVPRFHRSDAPSASDAGARLATNAGDSAGGRTRMPWVGVEAHRIGVEEVVPCVELHAFHGGYVGVAPVGEDVVNVCAVVRPDVLRAWRGGGGSSSRGVAGDSTIGAAGVLAMVARSVPAVAAIWNHGAIDPGSTAGETGPPFGAAHPVDGDVLLAGDAASLPHPVGGDGIAMALRSGRLVAAHTIAFLEGGVGAHQLPRVYARAWRREFTSRLRWCAALHGVLVRPPLVGPVVRLLAAWPAGMRFAIERSRGQALEIGGPR